MSLLMKTNGFGNSIHSMFLVKLILTPRELTKNKEFDLTKLNTLLNSRILSFSLMRDTEQHLIFQQFLALNIGNGNTDHGILLFKLFIQINMISLLYLQRKRTHLRIWL